MKTYLGSNKAPFEWENMAELQAEAKKYEVRIGNGVRIENGVHIGDGVRIGNGVRGAVVNIVHLTGLYKYPIDIIWTEEDVYIRLGCFTRTKTEWEGDFWNNDREFPQESWEGKRRWNAFEVCLHIIENEKNVKGTRV